MANFIALYDSCVLYPAPLRDLLMHLAMTDLYRANRPNITRTQLERTRELMNSNVRDCLVEGYEKLIPALNLPDLDDRHVLAAAIRSSSSVIVTFAARRQRQSLKKPPMNADEYLESLSRQSLKKAVNALQEFIDDI